MAKKSKIAKHQQQQYLIEHFAALRQELKDKEDYESINKLPRNSSSTRLKYRCELTGRPRGYMRKFKMSRIAFRELAHKGQLPGVRKASW